MNCAVLDTGCSRTVCRNVWLKVFIESLNPVDTKTLTEIKTTTKFRFGDGMVKQTIRRVSFPAPISGQKIRMTSDVINSEIPLLLSKHLMQQAAIKIDFSNDKVKILGKKLKLQFIASGHYAIPVGN